MTVKQIVEKIAGEHGLTAVVDARIGARFIPHIDQHTESNLGFLSRMAKRQGAMFKLADGKVIFAAKGSRILPSGNAKPALTLIPSQVTDWECEVGDRGGFGAVSCSYIDHTTGKRHAARAGSGTLIHRDKRIYGSQGEAEAAADATLGDLTRGKKKVDIDMPGDPTIFAEALVTLKGFDPDVDSDYVVKTVTHTYPRLSHLPLAGDRGRRGAGSTHPKRPRRPGRVRRRWQFTSRPMPKRFVTPRVLSCLIRRTAGPRK